MKKLIVGMLVTGAINAFAIQGTISSEGDSKTGDIQWNHSSRTYTVSVKKGKTMVDQEFKLAEVTSLDIPKPEAFDKAIEKIDDGQAVAAIPVLMKILKDYRMLQWDKQAARYLAIAYVASGDAEKAYKVCQSVISEDKTAAYTGEMASAYWQSLLKLGKNEELEKLVKKAAISGDRQASAAALVMRGDIIVSASNDQPEELKKALRDGYLRVVLMYKDEACKRERLDALNKAAACFDKLGQAARAEALRAQAKEV